MENWFRRGLGAFRRIGQFFNFPRDDGGGFSPLYRRFFGVALCIRNVDVIFVKIKKTWRSGTARRAQCWRWSGTFWPPASWWTSRSVLCALFGLGQRLTSGWCPKWYRRAPSRTGRSRPSPVKKRKKYIAAIKLKFIRLNELVFFKNLVFRVF